MVFCLVLVALNGGFCTEQWILYSLKGLIIFLSSSFTKIAMTGKRNKIVKPLGK